jgi:hypothetical protein
MGAGHFAIEFFNETAFASVELHMVKLTESGNVDTDEIVPQSLIAPPGVAPSAVLLEGSNTTINEGGSVGNVSLSANDSGSGVDPVESWIVHTGEQDVEFAGNALTVSVPFDDQGIYSVTADAVGLSGVHYPASGTFTVTVNNVLPTLGGLTAATYKVGDLATISLPLNDPGTASVHTATVDWGDGTITTPDLLEGSGSGVVYDSHAYTAAGSYTVTVTVHEGASTVQQSAVMTITNSASSLSPFSVAPINEGDTTGFSANFTDADPSDTHTAMVDWGDGTTEPAFLSESDGEGSVADSHLYADNGNYTVSVTLTDGSGAAVTQSASVAVANVAPRVDIGGFIQRFEAGADLPFSADVFDPGIDDTFTYQWSVLDANGQSVATGTGDTLTMTQPSVATYTLTLTVTDDDGGIGTASSTILVYPVGSPPTITAPAAPSGLSIGTASPDGVTISWTDNSSDEDGFAVEWSDDGSDFYIIDTVGAGTSSYDDEFPVLNVSNYYRVFAYADDAESSPSAADSEIVYTADVGVYDDNGGYNGRNTLSPFSVIHDHVLDNVSVFPNDVEFLQQLGYTASPDGDPSHGSLELADDGSFTYTPDPGFVGTDMFSYKIWNGHYYSAPAEVAIDVTNALPEAFDDTKQLLTSVVDGGTTYPNAAQGTLAATDSDGDTVTYTIKSYPEHGTFAAFDETTGNYIYAADPDYAGYDSFTYVANDGIADGQAAIVSLEDHNPPVQRNFYVSLEKDGLVLLNNHDIPGDQFITVTPPSHGEISPNTEGLAMGFYYTPDTGFTGTDIATLIRRRGNLDSKPFTVRFIVRDPSDPYPDYNGSASPGRLIIPIPADETVTRENGLTWFLSEFNPLARVEVDTNAQHGKVDLTPFGTLTYTPNPGESYRGWDFFSVRYTNAPLNTAPNWIVLDVGGSDPYIPPPPVVFTPEEFPNTLKGLWDTFIQAKNAIGPVLQKMEREGEIAKQIKEQGSDPTEGQQIDLVTTLQQAVDEFAIYTKCAQKAYRKMGEYKAAQHITTDWDNDVYAAINSLPYDIAGLKPDQKQLGKWQSAIAADARGTEFMVANANMVVQMAKDTHKAMQTALYAGGVASLAMSGTQLLTEKGCAEFVKWATQAAVSTGIGIGVNAGVSGALALAKKWGVPINEEYVQIAADGLQLFFLVKAAREQRKANNSNCFVAGTEVMTGTVALPGVFGETRIEDVKVGDLVWSRDQYDPNAPLELKRVAQAFKHRAYDLQSVSVIDETGNIEVLHVTDEHPFYVEGQGFTGAADLTVGDHLDSPDGHTLTVVGNADEKPVGGAWVYNFEVEEDHTYFVADGIGPDSFSWVHNDCDGIIADVEQNGIGSLRNAGNAGSGPDIRELPGTASEARKLFDGLSKTGQLLQDGTLKNGTKFALAKLSDGTYITFRSAGKIPNAGTGVAPPTIDINIPGQELFKLKLLP